MISPAPEFHRTRCVRYRYRYSECRRCLEACPHDAIALTDDGLALDAGKCANCALCTTVCRTAALVPPNLQRIDLLTQAIKRLPRTSIACTPSGAEADLPVPCLGALDAALLAYLGKRGIVTELRGSQHCPSCEHSPHGAQALASNCSGRDILEDALADETWAALVIDDSADAAPTPDFRRGRRQLFRRLLGKGVDEAAKAIRLPVLELPVVDKAIRPGPWSLPEMRELLQIVTQRADREDLAFQADTALPAASMRLGPGCTNCEACTRVCPTGALQIRESDSDWQLIFLADRCVGCGVCSEVCQPGVLRAGEIVNIGPSSARIVLNSLAKQRCQRCDRFFVSTQPAATCQVCADDEVAFSRMFG